MSSMIRDWVRGKETTVDVGSHFKIDSGVATYYDINWHMWRTRHCTYIEASASNGLPAEQRRAVGDAQRAAWKQYGALT